MRVAFLSANAAVGDAIGNYLAEQVAFFIDRGADVRVFVASTASLHPAVRPHSALWSGDVSHGDAWDYLTAADLVFAEFGQHHALLDCLPLLAGGRPRIVVDYHGITPGAMWDAQHRGQLDRGARDRGLVWDADFVLGHSRFADRELREPTGFPATRTVRMGYPVDEKAFAPGPPTGDLRQVLGLDPSTKLLLFVGRVAPNKRITVLVEALAEVRDRSPAIHAVIVGDIGDIYRAEAERCRERAAELGVADRLHFLGQVDAEQLRDAYLSADVLVTASIHEGFCLPMMEAMVSGLPVVAARATALPETVGDAGLTFAADDAVDLARQVERVLPIPTVDKAPLPLWGRKDGGRGKHLPRGVAFTPPPSPLPQRERGSQKDAVRLAVVACRYGPEIVGGAETSLRTIAESLHQAGHTLEVFTTGLRSETEWRDELPLGTGEVNGIAVHRFAIDPVNGGISPVSEQEITPETEAAYLSNTLRSTALLDALAERIDSFDAVLVGPYLFGLTFDVARRFADKVLLLPCFHDEPAARLPSLAAAYREVGGILYHSPEEQDFAQADLGINHPRSAVCGTWIDTRVGDAKRGRQRIGNGRFIVYCGRRSPHKNVPLLLDFARRYHQSYPGRFTFAFIGQGDVVIPSEPWARDLGVLADDARRDVVAAADALVQLSERESLSLVALEAWAQGVPVIAHAGCPVLAGQIERSQGGRCVNDYESFAAALDNLWHHPNAWFALGQQGQAFVQSQYGSRDRLAKTVGEAVRNLTVPLVEVMKQRGRERAKLFSREAWREGFAEFVERLLDAPPVPRREEIVIEPRCVERSVSVALSTVPIPVRVHNRGNRPAHAEGPAQVVVGYSIKASGGRQPPECGTNRKTGDLRPPLAAVISPGASAPLTVLVPVPGQPGTYRILLWAEKAATGERLGPQAEVGLTVGYVTDDAPVEALRSALAPAEKLQRLPDDYVDVTTGRFAAVKRWLKQKLLNNFRRAYVDVLSRQQSAFNRHVVAALHELTEWITRLEQDRGRRSADDNWRSRCVAAERHCVALEERVARLEELLRRKEVLS